MQTLGRLHLITDTRPGRDVLGVVAHALAAGFGVVQVRPEDAVTDREAFDLTVRVVALCRAAGATCLVNDRLHIALAAGADGGHVGATTARRRGPPRPGAPHAILGATARNPVTARQAVADGATYLGVGRPYATTTKTGLPDAIGPAGVRAVVEAVDVPVIAIGGVTPERAAELFAAGAHAVAVVGAMSASPDPAATAARFAAVLASAPATGIHEMSDIYGHLRLDMSGEDGAAAGRGRA
ncbi:thiamine phosphate synthase [Dactylosporangium sp. NBC_01737]|uniref:thiamine phosphate synthase n=1 Tax=Dactylosporangium sp. NBC_01737 TaxID=2975959 RepID=UPI003FA3888E|nr:thiamine phosphate synthase [Dactylosporangium sp. NBC_01737]